MPGFKDTEISKAIISTYCDKLLNSLVSDVIIVGAGPAGLIAALELVRSGFQVTVLEKRLSPGGGVWGGGIGMNQIVFQDAVLPVLDDIGIGHKPWKGELHVASAVELAAGLCFKAVQSGVAVFNLMIAQDVCVHRERVTGVVANRSLVGESLPVDPIMLSARAVIDATGHEAVVVQTLRRRGLLTGPAAKALEGPMNAESGEAFVVDNVAQVFPGLWVSGMSVSATLGGPRMGPIFGGMLLSGKRVAALVAADLARQNDQRRE